ncbi:MAG: hypothetical protein PHY09_14685 [Desulfuromonadaceae bacterium]|nr:hypothetical protein [Desulfuromonadaceae bacterium]MDD5104621.1 hypothetical protein [Desulfuromonadaceae bacterium]
MNNGYFKWLWLLALVPIVMFSGCGGGGGGGGGGGAPKATISGTVTFPSLNNLVGKRVAADMVNTSLTVKVYSLDGVLKKTATVTGSTYTADGLDSGVDYVIKAVDGDKIMKALIDKDSIATTTTRDINAIATTAVVLAEQKLGVPIGTIGEKANSISSTGIAGIQPGTIETNITNAVSTIKNLSAAATETEVNLVNLGNIVTATIKAGVDTSAFLTGTGTTETVVTTQYTFVSGAAPTPTTAPVTQTEAKTVVTTAAPTQAFIQYRTTEGSPYLQGWIMADTTAYQSPTLKDTSGNTIPPASATSKGKSVVDYQMYNCTNGSACTLDSPYQENGYYISLPVTLAIGNYSFEMLTGTTTVVTPVSYAGVVIVPAISSNTMNATKTNTDFNFTWQNPTTGVGWSSVAMIRIELKDQNVSDKGVLINLKTTAQSVSLPRSVVTLAGLNPNSTTLQWRIQTRHSQNALARGISNWKTIPAITTVVSTSEMLVSGLYYIDSNSYESSTAYLEAYATVGITLASDGTSLAPTYTYYDRTTGTWSTTLPSGVPAGLFDESSDYALTATGWVSKSGGPEGVTLSFNSDGSVTLTDKVGSGSNKMSVTASDISGQTISSQGAVLSWWPFLSNAGVFPSGSKRYNATWTTLTESFDLWGGDSVPSVSSISEIPNSGESGWIDSNDGAADYYALFVSGSTTVDIHKWSSVTSQDVKIGTGSYAISTVSGQQILEITIPSALRAQYALGGNPIFGIVGNTVYHGVHNIPGSNYGNSNYFWNSVAIQHLRNIINTSVAKPVMAKSISKAILGR